MRATPTAQSERRPNRRAFTLVEVLLALAITALVGLSVAAMLTATAYGTTSRQEMRGLLVKTQTISARLNAAIRTSKVVLYPNAGQATSNDYLVLWTADENDDSTKQNNEVQLIERNAVNNELNSYVDSTDTADFGNVAAFRTQALASYPSARWASGVTSLSLRATTDPAGTMLLSYRFTVAEGQATETAVGAAAPRQ